MWDNLIKPLLIGLGFLAILAVGAGIFLLGVRYPIFGIAVVVLFVAWVGGMEYLYGGRTGDY